MTLDCKPFDADAGADGCVGLPREDASRAAVIYPDGCSAYETRSGTSYQWVCMQTSLGADRPYAWFRLD